MPSIGAQLQHLHQLLTQLRDIEDELARGPRQIKARQSRVEAAQATAGEKEQELKDARAEVDKKNLELRVKETHLIDLQAKLNAAASNREYDIIRGQMEADRAAKAVLEDEILEWLDRVDAGQKEVAEAKQHISDLEQDVRKFANEFEQKSVTLHGQLEGLRAQIAEAETAVPGEIKGQYRRLVEAHGADALASEEKGICTHCFVSLTTQSRVMLNSGKLMFCSSCGRLLYPTES